MLEFQENKGQWRESVLFKANIPAGNMYLEKDAITYLFYNETDLDRLHHMHHQPNKNYTEHDFLLNMHAFRINLEKAEFTSVKKHKKTQDYVNYYLGKDTSKWASNVNKYEEVVYENIYANTDLKYYKINNQLKYDFIVKPGGSTENIKLNYEGVDEIFIEKNRLIVKTSVNTLVEEEPYAYQIIKGEKKEIKCKFVLNKNTVSFAFPKGYNKQVDLIIDPTLIFASYTGSTSDNWGYTSTFDLTGHLYGGGVTFGSGYPTTLGAYQTTFNGGNGNYPPGTDITITKFNPSGTNLIYSTYLGGSANESPHSLVVDTNNNLFILGTTSSLNFPVTPSAFDTSFNGGTSYSGTIPNYTNGSDIIVSKLNSDGTTLQASTFVGGSGNDGLNISSLAYNYGDIFRGEIIVDGNNNCYIASSTNSADFPTSFGAFQNNLNGTQDACIFKFDSNLQALLFSTYLGGDSTDAAYSVQLNNNGQPYVTGGTASSNFPVSGSALNTSNQGGIDGFITGFNSSATTLLASTYLGTNAYDQTFFVQMDNNYDVYVVGQTEGSYPIAPLTTYNVPNSGQFLQKLDPNLSTSLMSTVFGSGSGAIDVTPSAFLVNECNYILISFWGGQTNSLHGGPPMSTTNGLPTTSHAIQTTTDGSDYYLMMLGEDADTLLFATFFGGGNSPDHVDGGTSRFDKRGIVYQAVCASCYAATSDFPTSPNAYSSTDNSGNCNMGVFKIDLTRLTADAEVYSGPYFCLGDSVHFQNLTNGGELYYWDFDDGDTSNIFEPVHLYDSAGTYNVMLVAYDSVSCILSDTDYVQIYINEPPIADVDSILPICRGDSIQLIASGGVDYKWYPNTHISNDTLYNPFVYPPITTTYKVIVYDSCGVDSINVRVEVNQPNIDVIPDTSACRGVGVELFASGGSTYNWQPSGSLSNNTIANPIATPNNTTIYNVEITDNNNCVWDTSMVLTIDTVLPNALAYTDTTICEGDSVLLYATGGVDYVWSPSSLINKVSDSLVWAKPNTTTNFVVKVSTGCGDDYDTVKVNVHVVDANIVDDTTICLGDNAYLWASGGETYVWSPSSYLNNPTIENPIANIDKPTLFTVKITDSLNCTTTRTVFVDTLLKPNINLIKALNIEWGDGAQLNPLTNGVLFQWHPQNGLSCSDCLSPVANPYETTTYVLTVIDDKGCVAYDTITVYVNGSLFVPNSFTPTGDGKNDLFFAYGKDIADFEMYIFNRWGEQLFYSNDIKKGWDGTYKGELSKTDTYVWKIFFTDTFGTTKELYGTVTLIK